MAKKEPELRAQHGPHAQPNRTQANLLTGWRRVDIL